MKETLLKVHNLGKAYRSHGTEWGRVLSWFGVGDHKIEEHWVLQETSFSISTGEAIGIIGQNGAGKSTLLKLINGTTQPSEGRIEIHGRIAAILELGMGFNPEFTGRQNAFYSAGLMGFHPSQIKAIMPAIEDFAEIGEYFDQPVRTYSSGMQMRVAFSVASAFCPDILIIDEALSVGDAYFQHKSISRIRECQKQGAALLLVSHDSQAIISLCDRAILLESGRIIKDGLPTEVIDYYNATIAEKEKSTIKQRAIKSGQVQTVSGTGQAQVADIALLNAKGDRSESGKVGESVCLEILAEVFAPIPRLVLGIMIKDRFGNIMFGTNTHHTNQVLENLIAGETITYQFHFVLSLGPGSYSVSTALTSSDTHLVNNYEWHDLALTFTVDNHTQDYFIGTTWLKPSIKIDRNQ